MIEIKGFLKSIKISNKLKKEIVRYAVSFFFAWLISALFSDFSYFRSLIQSVELDASLTKLLVFLTESLLNIIGFETYSIGSFLKIKGTFGLRFAYGCLGFRELLFFIVFIILQFGKITNKLWYIPSGIILLILLNAIRAAAIAVGQYNSPENTQLIHDIISPVIMYPTIFFLWIFWIKTYGNIDV